MNPNSPSATRGVTRALFGTTREGEPVEIFTLVNAGGVVARVLTYGGILQSLSVPDRDGRFGDVVLGYDTLAGYLNDSFFLGALIGRYGNRIAGGRFVLDGRACVLATNNGPNHLHGGTRGFDKVVWQATPFVQASGVGLRLAYTSRDGEEGYPGTVDVNVTYTLTDDGALVVDYRATTDAATPINLTQHSYFNLAGHDRGDVLGHELHLAATAFTPTDDTQIPTGEIRPVSGTPFDFTRPTAIGARIEADDPQLRIGHGYDHNFVLSTDDVPPKAPVWAARVYEPTSGRVLEVHTTEPGLQFYSGHLLDGSRAGKGGKTYRAHAGFCLETQHFPDSPNHPHFPTTILRPGAMYHSRTIFTFSAAPASPPDADLPPLHSRYHP